MKRITSLVFSCISILALAGCGGSNSSIVSNNSDNSHISQESEPGTSTSIIEGENTVVLVLGPTGLYNGEKQGSYNIYENAVEYTADISSPLPGKDVVTSTSSGFTFETWISYEEDGTPTRFDKMPSEGYKVLHAWFKNGTDPDTSTSDSSTSDIPPVGDQKTIYLNPGIWETDSPKYYAWIWGGEDEGSWVDFVSDSALYKITIDNTHTGIIFFRAPQDTEHGWNEGTTVNYWNKTGDETINYTNNVFEITGWGTGTGSTGTWTIKS